VLPVFSGIDFPGQSDVVGELVFQVIGEEHDHSWSCRLFPERLTSQV
jgi:hypothetical protein